MHPNGDLMTDTIETTGPETPNGEQSPQAGAAEAPQPNTPRPAEEAPESEWKKYARQWEDIAKGKSLNAVGPDELKSLRDKAKRFDEIEEASKSDLEKAQARIAELEKTAAEATAAKLRSEIARTKGVPVELLTGADEDSLTAQADVLLAFKGTPPNAPSSEGQGKQGEPVGAGVRQLTRDEYNRLTPEQKLDARDKGQLANLLAE